MTKVTEIVHFFEQKVSSVLSVDGFPPELKKDRFVKEGGFWLRVADGEGNAQTIKLSDTEMTNLLQDIKLALKKHRELKLKLFADIDQRERSASGKDRD
ncbi:MAG: hypothetical protein ACFE9D_04045 [Promethearchaeota archaeon]